MAERNFEKMHAWVEERLSDYVDGQLDARTRAQLEAHLRDCSGCRTSFAALRWSMSLVKQMPAPKLPRTFVLPVPAKRAPSFGFIALRFATVAAMLVLFALIATDLLTQFGSAPMYAPAPAGVAREAVPATSAPVIAFAPTSAPPTAPAAMSTSAPKPAAPLVAATKAPEPTKAPAAAAPAALPTSAPKPTSAPPSALETSRTPTTGLGGNALETTTPSADRAKSAVPVTTTRQIISPTIAPSPTATTAPTRVAIVAPTVAAPTPKAAPQPLLFTPLRLAQFVMLFAVVFLGALTLLLWRRR